MIGTGVPHNQLSDQKTIEAQAEAEGSVSVIALPKDIKNARATDP